MPLLLSLYTPPVAHPNPDQAGIPAGSGCREIGSVHFEAAMLVARKSVSAADVKKFERFRKSIQIAK